MDELMWAAGNSTVPMKDYCNGSGKIRFVSFLEDTVHTILRLTKYGSQE